VCACAVLLRVKRFFKRGEGKVLWKGFETNFVAMALVDIEVIPEADKRPEHLVVQLIERCVVRHVQRHAQIVGDPHSQLHRSLVLGFFVAHTRGVWVYGGLVPLPVCARTHFSRTKQTRPVKKNLVPDVVFFCFGRYLCAAVPRTAPLGRQHRRTFCFQSAN